MENNNITIVRKGRTKKENYHNLDFEIVDMINEYGDIELLGFYLTYIRYINRKEFKNENEINYTQKYLSKQMNIGKTKYYKNLKALYNCGMLDIEKEMSFVFYVNFPNGESIKQDKTITFFSTLQNINISMKDPKTKLDFPTEYINIVSSKTKTIYVIHEGPVDSMVKNKKIEKYRDYDNDLDKFRRGETKIKDNSSTNIPTSQNEKEGDSQNKKEGTSQNEKVNTIIKSFNTIIEPPNTIIHSFLQEEEGMNELQFIKGQAQLDLFKDEKMRFLLESTIEDLYNTEFMKYKNIPISQLAIRKRLRELNVDILQAALIKYRKRLNDEIEGLCEPIKDTTKYFKVLLFDSIMSYSINEIAFDQTSIENENRKINEEDNTIIDDELTSEGMEIYYTLKEKYEKEKNTESIAYKIALEEIRKHENCLK